MIQHHLELVELCHVSKDHKEQALIIRHYKMGINFMGRYSGSAGGRIMQVDNGQLIWLNFQVS